MYIIGGARLPKSQGSSEGGEADQDEDLLGQNPCRAVVFERAAKLIRRLDMTASFLPNGAMTYSRQAARRTFQSIRAVGR